MEKLTNKEKEVLIERAIAKFVELGFTELELELVGIKK